jgi:YHS domain-containing protein
MKVKIFYLVVIFSLVWLILSCAPKQMPKEKVACSYCGMMMYKSAMEANTEYKGKTLYFCTKEELEEFKQDPEAYLSGKKKGKMKM